MSHYLMDFSDRYIRENTLGFREHLGMTQKEFVTHIGNVISRETLSHIESGPRIINNLRYVRAVARIMGVPMEDLVSKPWKKLQEEYGFGDAA